MKKLEDYLYGPKSPLEKTLETAFDKYSLFNSNASSYQNYRSVNYHTLKGMAC